MVMIGSEEGNGLELDEREKPRVVSLSEIGLPIMRIPKGYTHNSFVPGKDLDRDLVRELVLEATLQGGYDPTLVKKIFPGVIEAVKNAYEHGNRNDPLKRITFASRFDNESANFFVGDEGEEIDEDFFRYLPQFKDLKNRKGALDVKDYYLFSGRKDCPEGHSGVGTKVMHFVFNRVKYFQNKKGGLLVGLHKDC